MLLRFFKSTRSVNYLLFPVMGTALWFHRLMHPAVYSYFTEENNMPLFQLATFPLKTPLSHEITGLVLLILTAFILERINNQFAFIRIRTLLALPVFVLIVSGLPSLQTLHPVYLAAVFFALATYRLFFAFDARKPYSIAFDSGFLLGAGSLFYLNLAILLPAFLFSLGFLSRESRWREPLIQFTGFLLPWIFTFTWYFVADNPLTLVSILEKELTTWNVQVKNSVPEMAYLGFLLILITLSSIFMLTQYDERKISSRKYFVIFFIFFLSLVISVSSIPSASHEVVVLMALPVSYLVANFLVSIKSRFWGELIFSLLLLIVVAMQFISDFNLNLKVPFR